MAELTYEQFINQNPLYVHNKIEPLNNDIHIIRSKVKLDTRAFALAISKLREQENIIYSTLGNGNIKNGKNLLTNMAKNIYTENNNKKRIIELTRSLVNKIYVLSKRTLNWQSKFINSNGEIDEVKLAKEEKRLIKDKKTLESKIETVLLNVNFSYKEDKETGEISRNVIVKRGSSSALTDEKEIQELVNLFCNAWNDTIDNYDYIMEELLKLTQNQGLTVDNKSIKNFGIYLKTLQQEMQAASINGEIDTSKLSENFYKLFSKKGSYFGNIIGLFTEYCDYNFSKEVLEELKKLEITVKTLRADEISREMRESSRNSKADRITILKGSLDTPNRVTIPVSLKFRSDSLYKAHSGTISSISELIKTENENNGLLYSNYFKYLLINAPYWQYHEMDKFKDIILTILNNFAYVWISGGLEQNNLSKAVFISGTFLEGQEYEDYFLPVSKLLMVIYTLLKEGEEVLSWTALDKKDDETSLKIKQYKESEEYVSDIKSMLRTTEESRIKGNYSYDKFYNNALIIWQNEAILEKISNIIGSTDITFNHKIITENLFKGGKGVLL